MPLLDGGGVWDRERDVSLRNAGDGVMSKNLYVLSLASFTLMGLIGAALASFVSRGWEFTNVWVLLGFFIGVLVSSLIGVGIYNASSNPLVSFLGYGLVFLPFGLLLGPLVAMYTDASVLKVFIITIVMVAVLGVIGAIIPESLEKWGPWLLGGLLLLIVGYFMVPILGFLGFDAGGALTVLDWVGVVLFGALVIYDLNRAMRLEHTLDNAVDCAAAIFMDFINIFIRLLSLMGQRSQS